MILFTSDNLNEIKMMIRKNAWYHLAAAAFLALFAVIYEHFSHGVYSNYMIFAFLIPLVSGVIPSIIISGTGKRFPRKTALAAWNSGIAALAVGSVFQGVLEIYGTTNSLIVVYPVIGFLMLGFGALVYLLFPVREEVTR